MRVSTRFRYGLRVLVELAGAEGPVSVSQLARSQEVGPKYLERIVGPMRVAGLVESHRGAHGGYTLGRSPADISLHDLMVAVGDDSDPVACVSDAEACDRSGNCPTRWVWTMLGDRLRDFWQDISLQEVLVHSQEGSPDVPIS